MLLFVFKDIAMTFNSFYYFLKRQSDHLSSPLQPRIHARQKIQPMTSHSTDCATISKKIFILFFLRDYYAGNVSGRYYYWWDRVEQVTNFNRVLVMLIIFFPL